MKNPTRPFDSPIRVEHINFDALDYHHPERKKRQKSQTKAFGRDEFGRPNIINADEPVEPSSNPLEDDEKMKAAIRKDLQSKGL